MTQLYKFLLTLILSKSYCWVLIFLNKMIWGASYGSSHWGGEDAARGEGGLVGVTAAAAAEVDELDATAAAAVDDIT